jgi:uncharacterized protein (TIGR03437 family)
MDRLVCVLLTVAALQAQTFTTLANFDGTNGYAPSSLIQGADGNFYGTTLGSETPTDRGGVFKMTPAGVVTKLYSFCSQVPNCADGVAPTGLVQGTDGNFYGTTNFQGPSKPVGPSGFGTVFKMTPSGVLTTLHTFVNGDDGGIPYGLLIQASDGNFYGTTNSGGAHLSGTVFKITPDGVFTTLHSFASTPAEGFGPRGGLIQSADGNFYGTTALGGANGNDGTVFKMTPTGVLTTLYSFGATPTDGLFPDGGLAQGADGNFYGTTLRGGNNGPGILFRITPAGVLTSLYSFTGGAGGDGSNNTLLQASDGNFYGTSTVDGASNQGAIFQITPSGAFQIIHAFDLADGGQPNGLIQTADGNIYGTTKIGGTQLFIKAGTVFRVSLSLPVRYTCTNTAPPVITSVDSASAYGGYPYFASGSWLEIKGTNLADPADSRQWTTSDFTGLNAPTVLDGVSVSINGKPAYVWYLSPTQLNVQAPEDPAIGSVAIAATNCNATSVPFLFAKQALAPGLLNYSAGGKQYMVATFASDGAYVLNTSVGAAFGLNSRPAKPGDLIIAYGIGFGDNETVHSARGYPHRRKLARESGNRILWNHRRLADVLRPRRQLRRSL